MRSTANNPAAITGSARRKTPCHRVLQASPDDDPYVEQTLPQNRVRKGQRKNQDAEVADYSSGRGLQKIAVSTEFVSRAADSTTLGR